MARGDQLARQWKIIQTLLSTRQGKSAAEMARHLGCHSRTIYRDLEALQYAGFPIYTEKIEGKNQWSLLDTARAMPSTFINTSATARSTAADSRFFSRMTC